MEQIICVVYIVELKKKYNLEIFIVCADIENYMNSLNENYSLFTVEYWWILFPD